MMNMRQSIFKSEILIYYHLKIGWGSDLYSSKLEFEKNVEENELDFFMDLSSNFRTRDINSNFLSDVKKLEESIENLDYVQLNNLGIDQVSKAFKNNHSIAPFNLFLNLKLSVNHRFKISLEAGKNSTKFLRV